MRVKNTEKRKLVSESKLRENLNEEQKKVVENYYRRHLSTIYGIIDKTR